MSALRINVEDGSVTYLLKKILQQMSKSTSFVVILAADGVR